MDDSINEIINYISETPENTNNQILRPMLQKLGNSGSGGGAAPFVVGVVYKNGDSGQRRTDKTVQEVLDAIEAGQAIVVHDPTNTECYFFGPRVQTAEGNYGIYWETYWYYASTTSDYFEEDMG